MARYVFDIETNGFLDALNRVHSLALKDADSGERFSYAGCGGMDDGSDYTPIPVGLARLAAADEVIGHNIIRFDLPALRKVYPDFSVKGKVTDTLVLSRLVFPDIKQQLDFDLNKRGKLPGKKIGEHGLEAWGFRLGNHKGEYTDWCKANGIADPWAHWSPEMQSYCEQDVEVTFTLYTRLLSRMEKQGWRGDCVELEHAVAHTIHQQELYGWAFDEAAAAKLYAKLVQHRVDLEAKLQAAFPPKEVITEFVPKANNSKLGYQKGIPFMRRRVEVFNPSSHKMIAERLQEKHGWKPIEFTPGGQPKLDEGTLDGLPWPEAKLLNEYLMVQKRIGALAEGKKSWLKFATAGRIHGRVITNGAFTGRMTHRDPNLAQVPSVDVPYGKECRALFTASAGRVLVGCDADALELRCLAHYLAKYDGGAYVEAVIRGDKSKGTDSHSVNCRALGMDPKKLYKVGSLDLPGRDIAKTWFYAFIYGAGALKLGQTVGVADDEAARKRGSRQKRQFLQGLPALGRLLADLNTRIERRGFIFALDGRALPIRSAHAALNTLLQSAGAIAMKKALIIHESLLVAEGLRYRDDYAYVGNIHDEWQIDTLPQHADTVGRLAAEAIRLAGEHFKFRCPLAGNYGSGATWAETH